jgi:hypothetical protein
LKEKKIQRNGGSISILYMDGMERVIKEAGTG